MSFPFVSEDQIDTVAENLQEENLEEVLEAFSEAQPAVAGYLFSETFEVLYQEERQYVLYLALVIWKSVSEAADPEMVTDKDLGSREEENWGLFEKKKSGGFRQKMDVFFEDCKQEDLLAFVEDSLVIEDDGELEIPVSKEGRIPMAVGLKTIIDVLTAG
ncbi:MAG: hypothetical protein GYB31_15755 [Bacteroidetes bacterium]|nr:hypothetical protein [Bacteroidota bacterium]